MLNKVYEYGKNIFYCSLIAIYFFLKTNSNPSTMRKTILLLAIVAIFNACTATKKYTVLDNNENLQPKASVFSKTSFLNIVVIVDTLENDTAPYKSAFASNLVARGKEYFQENLVSDLQYSFDNSGYHAKFFTEKEAIDQNIKVNWKMKLRFADLDVPLGPNYQTYYNSADLNVLYNFPQAGLSSEVIAKDFAQRYARRDPVSSIPGETIYNGSGATVVSSQSVNFKTKALTFLRYKLKVDLQNIETGKKSDIKPLNVKRPWEFDADEYVIKKMVNGKEVVLDKKSKEYYNAIPTEILKNIYAEVYPYLLDIVSQKMF